VDRAVCAQIGEKIVLAERAQTDPVDKWNHTQRARYEHLGHQSRIIEQSSMQLDLKAFFCMDVRHILASEQPRLHLRFAECCRRIGPAVTRASKQNLRRRYRFEMHEKIDIQTVPQAEIAICQDRKRNPFKNTTGNSAAANKF
jgi:hypothetical protein